MTIPLTYSNGQATYPSDISDNPGNYTVIVTAKDNIGLTSFETTTCRLRETYTVNLT